MTYKLDTAKEEFRELLTETKIVSYKSKKLIAENEQHLKDILAVLEVVTLDLEEPFFCFFLVNLENFYKFF